MKSALIALLLLLVLTGGLYLSNGALSRQAEAAFPPRGRFIDVDGQRMHFLEAGSGPPVVLLHGANGALQDFTATIMDELATRYRVIAVDRPGHGYSTRTYGAALTPAEQAGYVRGVLRHLNVERPLLVGFSWSGSLVLAYALAHPDEVAGLVSLAGAAYEWPGPIDLKWRMPGWPVAGDLIVHLLPQVIGRAVADAGIAFAFAPEAVTESYAGAPLFLALRPGAFRANADDIRLLKPVLREQSARYGELALPIGILHGDADKVVSAKIHSQQLHAEAPNTELRILEGAGHLLPYTRPDEVIAMIDRTAARAGLVSADENVTRTSATGD